jgi:hypothetical protein
MQPSRVTDSFRLELRSSAPRQCEEDAIRDFVDWLADIPIGTSSPPLTEETFISQLRAAAQSWLEPTSPPQTGDYMFGSAPAGAHSSEDLLRAALRLWATELRPLWMAHFGCGYDDTLSGTADDAVLLGTLTVPLISAGGAWQVSDVATIGIDETRRPILLSLRMVQELITQNPIPVAGDTVRTETTFGVASSAGASLRYSREDHTHGTPPLPQLGGDLSGPIGNARIERIQTRTVSAASPGNGQALVFNGTQWAPANVVTSIPGLSGDLTGLLGGTGTNTPRVAGLQGRGVATTAPTSGQGLLFDGTQWAPGNVSASGNFVGRTSGAFEIVAAGDIVLSIANGAFTFPAQSNYGSLAARQGSIVTGNIQRALITLTAAVPGAASLSRYVVKLTPMLTADARATFALFLEERTGVSVTGPDAITFQVVLVGSSQISDGAFAFRFQAEVSRFGGR